MKPVECGFEEETLATVLQARWPERVDAELRAHVAGCEICSDVAAVAGGFDEARNEARACAVLPDSGRVWRMAQLRARREAVEAAGRPIAVAQAIAFACAAGLLGACFGATSNAFQSAIGRIASRMGELDVKALTDCAISLLSGHGSIVFAMAALVFLIPTAVLVVLGRD